MDWRFETIIPDEIHFFLPGKEDALTQVQDDLEKRYPQLVLWLLVQRYWTYVLHTPKAPDAMYDRMKAWTLELEESGECQPCFRSPANPNGCSPRWKSGWYLPCRYPELVQAYFPQETYPPQLHLDRISEEYRGLFAKEIPKKPPRGPVQYAV